MEQNSDKQTEISPNLTNNVEKNEEILAPTEVLEVLPAVNLNNLVESIAACNKPICDDADLQCIIDMVIATLCEAVTIIESDPRGLFCYKYPTNSNSFFGPHKSLSTFFQPNCQADDCTITSDMMRHWIQIREFDYNNTIAVIRDQIGQWMLSPETKCVVLTNTRRHEVAIKGTIHFVDAHFSRPTHRCPNPLAVAKVRFIITVSSVMPKYYPVMITYRFEGYRTLYYGLGTRAIGSNTFQRFYIDTILHSKLSFYAEICECRHGTVAQPKPNIKRKKPKKL